MWCWVPCCWLVGGGPHLVCLSSSYWRKVLGCASPASFVGGPGRGQCASWRREPVCGFGFSVENWSHWVVWCCRCHSGYLCGGGGLLFGAFLLLAIVSTNLCFSFHSFLVTCNGWELVVLWVLARRRSCFIAEFDCVLVDILVGLDWLVCFWFRLEWIVWSGM